MSIPFRDPSFYGNEQGQHFQLLDDVNLTFPLHPLKKRESQFFAEELLKVALAVVQGSAHT